MKRPEEISSYELPDTKSVPDGWDWKSVAESTAENMQLVIDRHNELVELVLLLADRVGVEFGEE